MSLGVQLTKLGWSIFVVGALQAAAAQESQPTSDSIRFSGRVLSADGPLAGVRIEAIDTELPKDLYFRLNREQAAQLEVSAKSLGKSVRTDAEGRWAFELPAEQVRWPGLGFRVLSKTHASVVLYPRKVLQGGEWVSEDLILRSGFRIQGFAESKAGQVVRDLGGHLRRGIDVYRGHRFGGLARKSDLLLDASWVPVRGDRNGAFQTEWAVGGGPTEASLWHFESETHRAIFGQPLWVHSRHLEALQLLWVVRREGAAIIGRVVDHEGLPLSGVKLELLREWEQQVQVTDWRTTSDATGEFRLDLPDRDDGTWFIRASRHDHMHHHDQGQPGQVVPQGHDPVAITMLPLHTVTVIARRADDGTLLSGFRVRRITEQRTETGGASFRRPSLALPTVLEVLPKEEQLGVTSPIVLPAFEIIREVVIDVPRAVRREISVQDASGNPIAYAAIRAVLPWPAREAAVEREDWHAERAWPTLGVQRAFLKTDKSGRAVLQGAEGVPLELQIEAQGFVRRLVQNLPMEAGTATLVLSLENVPRETDDAALVQSLERASAATVTGHMIPTTFASAWRSALEESHRITEKSYDGEARKMPDQGLLLVRADALSAPLRWPEKGLVRLAKDGSFAIEGVPPGRWQLSFQASSSWSHGMPQEDFPLTPPFELRPGEHRHFDLELGDQIPATVSMRLVVDGKPIDQIGASWRGWARGAIEKTLIEASPTIEPPYEQGRAFLPPGSYHLVVDLRGPPDDIDNGLIFIVPSTTIPKEVIVKPGVDQNLTLDLKAHRDSVLRLKKPGSPRPIPGVRVLLRAAESDPGIWIGGSSTAGMIDLPILIEGRYELLVLPAAIQRSFPTSYPYFSLVSTFGASRGPMASHKLKNDLRSIGHIEVSRGGELFEIEVPADLGW